MAEIEERIEILRRIAERGMKSVQNIPYYISVFDSEKSQYIDIWQHLLNEIDVLKKAVQEIKEKR